MKPLATWSTVAPPRNVGPLAPPPWAGMRRPSRARRASARWPSPPSASWMPWCGTVSCRSASVGAATTPPASSLRRLIARLPRSARPRILFDTSTDEILTDQNPNVFPSSRSPPVRIGRDERRRAPAELDAQYRALREAAGSWSAPSDGCSSSPAARPPSTSRASSPTTSRRWRRARAATRRCSTARATCRATCGSCGWPTTRSGSAPRRSPPTPSSSTWRCTRSAATSRSTIGSGTLAVISVIGPAAIERAGRRPAGPEHAHRELRARAAPVHAPSPPTSAST